MQSQMSQSEIKIDVLSKEIMQYYYPSSAQSSNPQSIYKVPRTLRDHNQKAYSPRVVSIGLIHANDPNLQPMNEHKKGYMFSLFRCASLSEGTDFTKIVDRCVRVMVGKAGLAKERYPPSVVQSDDVARTMLVDGCFVLELLMRSSDKEMREPNDPIFSKQLKFRDVKHDLLLLENQIPFFVLEELFTLTAVKRIQNPPDSFSLKHLILEFFGNRMKSSNFNLTTIGEGENENPDHILGLLHSCYRPAVLNHGDYMITKYSATELRRSGINFKPSKGDDYKYLLVDFQTPCLFSWLPNKTLSCSGTKADTNETAFLESKPDPAVEKQKCCLFSRLCQLCCRPTLEIPLLCIDDSTEPLLKNLIAFEQCSQETPGYITSYAFLMDTIINSKEDVELLEGAGVLKHYLGTGRAASNIFNNLCKGVILGEFYYSQQWQQADHYCKRYWPSHIASLKGTYFSSPWTRISLFAALIVFAFTAIQAVCSLISL